MWIARNRDGYLGIYENKPVKSEKFGFWIPKGISEYIPEHLFPEVRWSDAEPAEVVIKRKE